MPRPTSTSRTLIVSAAVGAGPHQVVTNPTR